MSIIPDSVPSLDEFIKRLGSNTIGGKTGKQLTQLLVLEIITEKVTLEHATKTTPQVIKLACQALICLWKESEIREEADKST